MRFIKDDRRAFTRWALACAFGGIRLGSAQQQPVAEPPEVIFRSDTGLALVRFHVTRKNRYVEDVRASDIELLEDGVVQKLVLFEGPTSGPGGRRTIPIELILLMDVSRSVMNEGMLDAFIVKETLLDGLGGNISISVYVFGDRLRRVCAPTNDVVKLKQAFDLVYKTAFTGTRLYEAIMETARVASTASGANATRLMLVMSDGFATTKTPPRNAAKVANAYGIPIYPMVLGHDKIVKQIQAQNQPARPGANPPIRYSQAQDRELEIQEFALLGELTGGRSFDPPMANSLIMRSILKSMVSQIVCEYVVGYNPGTPGATPQTHKVKVQLRNKSLGKLAGGTRLLTH
jgi:VWFA-related protein